MHENVCASSKKRCHSDAIALLHRFDRVCSVIGRSSAGCRANFIDRRRRFVFGGAMFDRTLSRARYLNARCQAPNG